MQMACKFSHMTSCHKVLKYMWADLLLKQAADFPSLFKEADNIAQQSSQIRS